ncbi:MAG: hypothetical protein H6594_12870 [Flavobacteriales bacterium]|nr:hypothetical protein [Flavobacteriales bacterium]
MTNKLKHGQWPAWAHHILILGPIVISIAYHGIVGGGPIGFLKAFNAIGMGLWSITLSAAWLVYKNSERQGERELLVLPKEKGATAAMAEAWDVRFTAANEKVMTGKVGLLAVQRTVAVLAIIFGAMRVIMYLCGERL